MKEIPLTQGYVALIDDADYPEVSKLTWHAKVRKNGTVYAGTNIRIRSRKYRWTGMHTFLMQPPAGLEVDHRDSDGLNNQRGNLRVCTHAENMANRRAFGTSKYLGVCRTPRAHGFAWVVSCANQHVGTYYDESQAAFAYDLAAQREHKEFARLNFPDGEWW